MELSRTYTSSEIEYIIREAWRVLDKENRPTAAFFASFSFVQVSLERKIEISRADFLRQGAAVRAMANEFREKVTADEIYIKSPDGRYAAECLNLESENLHRKEARFYEALGFPTIILRGKHEM